MFTVESSTPLSARSLRYLDGMETIARRSGHSMPSVVLSVDWHPDRFTEVVSRSETYGPAFTGLATVHPEVRGVRVRQSDDGRDTIIVWDDESAFSYRRESGRLAVSLGPGCRSADYVLGFAVGALAVSGGCVGAHHGSVVRWRDKNVLIAGASGHGKTSISLAAAAAGGQWVTEDVTYMHDGTFIATMMRGHLSIRQGTYVYFRDLLPHLTELENEVSSASGRALFDQGKRHEAKVSVPPSLIWQPASTVDTIDAVLFPRIHPDAGSVRLTSLRPQVAVGLLDCMLSRPIAFTLMDCVRQDASSDLRWAYPRADRLEGIPAASVRFPLDYRSLVPSVLDELLDLPVAARG
jgi:hypothetical protein